MFNLHRKHHLAKHLEKMRRAYPDQYRFYPRTWQLPNDLSEVVARLKLKQKQSLIAKPFDKSQGRGIFIMTSPEDVPVGEKLVVQEYIES